MNQTLIIAEKPSVAKSLADVLGAKSRKNGSYEGNGYIVSWCVGHLLGLAEPQFYDKKYATWQYEDLPIAPKEWKYIATPSTKKQLKILVDLMKRSDVKMVVNACDAGREGELIFRLVYNHALCNKPIKRLWISSLEESAIADGFNNLRDGTDYDSLYHSARCRQQADWLVGMNFSRMFSVLCNTAIRVGRVQTPTLAMIVEREQKISDFVKEPFYVVGITVDDFVAECEKVKDKPTAEAIRSKCDGKIATVKSIEQKEKTESAPKLYDLTTLQREANRLFGYTATQTLNAVQNLYEQKIVTYPRTDSRFITEDMAGGIPSLVQSVSVILPFSISIDNINTSQIANNAKVSDHHAIIPTPALSGVNISSLQSTEKNILMMICTRLLSAVSEKYIYAETVITLDCIDEIFTSKGKTITQNGWKAIEQAFIASISKTKKSEDKPLPPLTEGQQFTVKSSIREGHTKPPKHYTEDMLLSAMETAGAEDMPDDAERKGLGTPATRAAIIENLVKSGLMVRKNKLLLPTDKGVNLIKILPDSVKSPSLTAEWENHLKHIERKELSADDFMTAINRFVADMVKTHNSMPDEFKALFPSNNSGEVIGQCPRCSGSITESPKGFFCDNKACKFALWKNSKYFTSKKIKLTKDIVNTLLTKGRIFMSEIFSEKTGKTYNATIILDDNGEGYPSFKMEFANKGTKKNG